MKKFIYLEDYKSQINIISQSSLYWIEIIYETIVLLSFNSFINVFKIQIEK